jgi:hypothetical protein
MKRLTLRQVIHDEFRRDATAGERLTFFILLPVWYLAYRFRRNGEDLS